MQGTASINSSDPFLRDASLVAVHEWSDAVRSRRAVVWIFVFGFCALLGTLGLAGFLRTAETQIADVMDVDVGSTAGAISVVWHSELLSGLITHYTGDAGVTASLLRVHPLALFYGWWSVLIAPWLIALMSSGRIADGLSNGSARFVVIRTARWAWAAGVFGGEALIWLAALAAGGCVMLAAAAIMLPELAGASAAIEMAWVAGKVWIYGLAFLGFVFALSAACRSAAIANGLGLLGCLVLTGIHHAARAVGPGSAWGDSFSLLLPQRHAFDLLRADWIYSLPAVFFEVALAGACLSAGCAWLSRRDV